MTQQEFLAGLAQVKLCWPHEKWTSERMQLWFNLLQRHDGRDWVAAVTTLVRTCKERFCPPPAQVIELVEAERDRREAFERQNTRRLELTAGDDAYVGTQEIRELIHKLSGENEMGKSTK
jgi:hypothetical protein